MSIWLKYAKNIYNLWIESLVVIRCAILLVMYCMCSPTPVVTAHFLGPLWASFLDVQKKSVSTHWLWGNFKDRTLTRRDKSGFCSLLDVQSLPLRTKHVLLNQDSGLFFKWSKSTNFLSVFGWISPIKTQNMRNRLTLQPGDSFDHEPTAQKSHCSFLFRPSVDG